MKQFSDVEATDLEIIVGGDDYGSWLHPNTWWFKFEKWASQPRPTGSLPTCENYTPAYPGKVLPQC